jgi:ribosome maturation factor RimP
MANMADPVRDLIEPTIQSMGFDLVRVAITGDVVTTLQIMAERPDGSMTVEDCTSLSRSISAILDVEDPISGEYNLEVSSPGIDRPLVKPEDFERFAGFEAKIALHPSTPGRRKYRGRILGFQDNAVVLQGDHEDYRLNFTEIASAKLVLTDELIDAHLAAEAANQDHQAAEVARDE